MRNQPLLEPSRRREASNQELQSQLALELLLNLYAVVASLVLLRNLLLLLGVDDGIWIGRTIYRLSRPFTLPFELLPGSSTIIIGDVTLGDLTLLAIVIMFPLGVYAQGTRRREKR
jgi:hypothetical protein